MSLTDIKLMTTMNVINIRRFFKRTVDSVGLNENGEGV